MMEIKDVLELLGRELKDDDEKSKRFRDFIEQEKWTIENLEDWLDECINNSSGAHDPYNRAFQDLIISLGKRLGFEIEYGLYMGRSGEDNYDGAWRRENIDTIILEVKTSAWPISGTGQLRGYLDKVSGKEDMDNLFGLYVIGKGDTQPLTEQILGSAYKDKIRLILYKDLIEILKLKQELEPVIGEINAAEKVENLLIPIESINIGNIVHLILEIAETKTAVVEEGGEEEEEGEEAEDLPWTKSELNSYLNDSTDFQRLLLAALVQADKEPVSKKNVLFLMTQIAKRRLSEDVGKMTGYTIAGARAGLKMRRKPVKKEDIIDSSHSHGEYYYKIKGEYNEIVTNWVKKENLWIKEEIE